MKIVLLTHEREVERPTNTGVLALAGGRGGLVERRVWSRVAPDQSLAQMLEGNNVGLLYPLSESSESDGTEVVPIETCEQFVLLDATWQEARKMYNRTAYLQKAPRIDLAPSQASRFRLRRNQKSTGLCTVECVIEILRCKGRGELASDMERAFLAFNEQSN